MKFLKADYLEEEKNESRKEDESLLTQEERKKRDDIRKGMEKIRKLDARLA